MSVTSIMWALSYVSHYVLIGLVSTDRWLASTALRASGLVLLALLALTVIGLVTWRTLQWVSV